MAISNGNIVNLQTADAAVTVAQTGTAECELSVASKGSHASYRVHDIVREGDALHAMVDWGLMHLPITLSVLPQALEVDIKEFWHDDVRSYPWTPEQYHAAKAFLDKGHFPGS